MGKAHQLNLAVEIEKATTRIGPHVLETPLFHSVYLSELNWPGLGRKPIQTPNQGWLDPRGAGAVGVYCPTGGVGSAPADRPIHHKGVDLVDHSSNVCRRYFGHRQSQRSEHLLPLWKVTEGLLLAELRTKLH
jgi:hypothetical protein